MSTTSLISSTSCMHIITKIEIIGLYIIIAIFAIMKCLKRCCYSLMCYLMYPLIENQWICCGDIIVNGRLMIALGVYIFLGLIICSAPGWRAAMRRSQRGGNGQHPLNYVSVNVTLRIVFELPQNSPPLLLAYTSTLYKMKSAMARFCALQCQQ